MVGKSRPVIVQLCLKSKEFRVRSAGVPEGWSPGQLAFARGDSVIVGIAVNREPINLGMVYCNNRYSTGFQTVFRAERLMPQSVRYIVSCAPTDH